MLQDNNCQFISCNWHEKTSNVVHLSKLEHLDNSKNKIQSVSLTLMAKFYIIFGETIMFCLKQRT